MSHETISALIDGECSPEELDRLLEEMEASPEMKREFSRQVMAREAREGTRIGKNQPCICADVMARLDEAPGDAHPQVVEFVRPRAALAPQWRPLAGLAAAAAFGAIAVLVALPQIQQHEAMSAAADVRAPAAIETIPVVDRAPARRSRAAAMTVAAQPEDLQEYLVDHSYAAATGATVYNADYRPNDDAGSGDRR
jgi:negative regulator of sigma E activity